MFDHLVIVIISTVRRIQELDVSSVEIRRIRLEIVWYHPPNNNDLYSNQLQLNNHLMSDL